MTTIQQGVFDFKSNQEYGRNNFVVSNANKSAIEYVENWMAWNNNVCNVFGTKACGKTHLAHIWHNITGAVFVKPEYISKGYYTDLINIKQAFILDNYSQKLPETDLFHFINLINQHRSLLLICSEKPVATFQYKMPDLASRMSAIVSIGIEKPDDELFLKLLDKHFLQKQLRVNHDVLDFLSKRLNRSYTSINNAVAVIDEQSLKDARNITVPFAKQLIDEGKI